VLGSPLDMAVLRCQLTLNPAHDPEHWYVNTYHFQADGAVSRDTATAAFQGALQTFMSAIDGNLANLISGQSPLAKFYDLTEPRPRIPYIEWPFTPLTTGSNSLPPELCTCMSYAGTYTSGLNPQRSRGRIYLGPLSLTTANGSDGRMTSAAQGVFNAAAQVFLDASQASTDWTWLVYSRANDNLQAGLSGQPVVRGWFDSDFDIQRRRSLPPGTRSTFT
jgi:hypothetical protein